MISCSQFNHPEAQQMCYAVQAGQLGDATARKELEAMEIPAPQMPKDQVSLGQEHPEAAEYFAYADQLRAMATGQSKG
jgi:hypothetical protein